MMVLLGRRTNDEHAQLDNSSSGMDAVDVVQIYKS